MTEKRVMKLASRGKRFGAACIDAVVPTVSYTLINAVLAANGIKIGSPGYGFGNDFGYGYGYGFGYGYGYDIGMNRLNGASAAIMVAVFLMLLAYIVLEFVLFARGKSIGKAILGLQVVSSTDGKPFRFWKMLFRECLVKSASGSVFGLGYIWVLIDDKNRGWHDKILDSYVVDLKESERMQLKRHLEKVSAEAQKPSPAPSSIAEPVQEPLPEVKEPEAEVTTVTAETEIEVTPVTTEPEAEVIPVTAETEIEVTPVAAETEEEAAPVAAEAEPEVIPEIADADEEITEDAVTEMPEYSMAMKKEELLEAARARGVQISSRATKSAIIEALEKAAETDNKE